MILPRGGDFEVVSAVKTRRRSRPGAWPSSARACPKARTGSPTGEPGKAALGWLLAQHRFDAYRSKKDEPERGPRVLVTGEPARIDETVRLAEATALVRDLVNTPAGDLGPAELEQAVRDEASAIGRAAAGHRRATSWRRAIR